MLRVGRLLDARVAAAIPSQGTAGGTAQLTPGKMLRTRLAARLATGVSEPLDLNVLAHCCAATELIHTASLCHDDVIDDGMVRRGRPALWREVGTSGAVLIGDLLFCASVQTVADAARGSYVCRFVQKVREMCAAEAEQELGLRGRSLDVSTCIRVARGKTGPLFAFVASCCGGDDRKLSEALEEAGYRVGTAYQLADDLLDVVGDESVAGKTLGSDRRRHKATLAMIGGDSAEVARVQVGEQFDAALECLRAWPAVREALATFLSEDVVPVLERQVGSLELRAEFAE
jgi:geranylgeranyl pyrophosphate synthase